jgi:predicted CXXCH cytochrome family protein
MRRRELSSEDKSMRRYSTLLAIAVCGLTVFLCLPSSAEKKSAYGIASFAKYVQIPGATPVGAEACTTCHSDIATSFRHAFHAQQGLDCEACHGPGSLHVAGGGDIAKIISFRQRSATDANGVCLSCHAQDAKVRNWNAGPHASNKVRCIDCHQTHNYGGKAGTKTEASFDVMAPGRATAVQDLVPESKVIMQPRWQANDACLKCHQRQRGEMSLPYHHPLREGKMSCADCHDPHGGAAGNNLRTANVNQLCLGCHAQYRGPFAYQHPPVTENCMTCHSAHGSPNTNLLSVSEPALCLQCHTGHHNGAGLPLPDRCTNCHGSIHGTDVATPSGGSRFVDKGPYGVPVQPPQPLSAHAAATRVTFHSPMSASVLPVPSHMPMYGAGAASGSLAAVSAYLAPLSGGNMSGGNMSGGNSDSTGSETEVGAASSAYSITPGSYRFLDGSGFLGRVGEYDSLQQSAGADAATAYVSPQNHVTIVSRGNVLTGDDYSAASQLTVGEHLRAGFDTRSFVQQQDNYAFYAGVMSPDLLPITDLIPSHTTFGVKRRLGNAYAQFKVPKLPVHLFVKGGWQARSGVTQLAYLDENTTPNCGELCHYTSHFQPVNYTTRNIAGGADVDLGPVRLTYQHQFTNFNDRLIFPIGAYAGPFTPVDEPPPPPVPVPPAVAPGNYYLDIPSPNQSSSDSLNLSWTASPKLSFNGNVNYTRLRNTLTGNPQNGFDSDETLNWRPVDRLRVTADYHQQNVINNFTPFYSLYGNVSYHNHWEGVRLDYELPKGFDVEAHYRRSGITRSNASLWPQIYSFDNTDLLTVVPSSFSNTTGLALRYRDRSYWSARAGYEWTGTHDPGYLIVPQSNNRAFADISLTPTKWLVFTNDTSIILQNAFSAVPLPNTPGDFQRRNRFYTDTASATFRFVPSWNLGLGYSYQQNNLTTYMDFQNDSGVGYVVNEPAVPYKQISQTYWGESTYTVKQRLGLNFRLTYNSARSGMRPDVNPDDAALLGNASLIQQGICESGTPPPCFDPVLFQQALGNLQLGATQVSQVIVPQWIGQSKAYYLFPRKFEGGLIFYYGSYRDQLNPNLNGVLRTFNVYVGRSW